MERYDLITGIIGSRGKDEESSEDIERKENVSPSSLLEEDRCSSPRITTSKNKLISILAENSEVEEGTTRKPICIEPKPPRRRETPAVGNILQIHLQRGNCGVAAAAAGTPPGNITAKYGGIGSSAGKQKIPRPANAFMLFANEWRKKLAIQNPRESNKDISVRLGVLWKNMAKGIKEKYFALAREVDAEHKRKYPDYVYNPKEARLRKAMREQSRELSRQSILQTAIGSSSGTGNVSSSGVVTSSGFLNHPLTCSSSSVSSLPNSPSVVNTGRIINPWFPVGPASSSAHLKPIISPRIMAAHQRTMEKTKEAMRKQVECATAGVFSSGSTNPSGNPYGGDFSPHNNTPASPNDYCIIAEFGDGQKWHPYQNGGNPYHGRGAAMSKVGLHPNPNMHGPWAQFCGLPLQSSPGATVQNQVIRPSRQMVFLQEQQQQQQGQHCPFSDEMQMQAYVQNKIDVNPRLHPAYSGQGDPQAKSSAASPSQMHQLQDDVKCNEVSQGWESGGSSSGGTGVSSLIQDQVNHQEHDDDQGQQGNTAESNEEPRQKPSSKQPLPGFHQAFGSTEIGRFSRSEFFANMVGENSNTIPEAYLSTPVFPFSPSTQSVLGTPTMSSIADEDLFQMMPEDCYWLGASPNPFSHSQTMENATNYAAFLDYSHRMTMSQEWLHPGSATAQELQAAFIEQPSLFHESNSLLGHEHLNYGSYPCPGYDHHNRRTPNNGISEVGSLSELIEANEHMANSKQSVVIKQNERICVMLEDNQAQVEKDI